MRSYGTKGILFFWITLIVYVNQSCIEDEFSIHGNIRNTQGEYAYLIHKDLVKGTSYIIDSSEVVDNEFSFHGRLEVPCECQILIGNKTKINLIVENSKIEISGTARIPEEIKIRGSKNENDFQTLVETYKQCQAQKNNLWSNMVNDKDSTSEKQTKDKIIAIEDSMINSCYDFVERNPRSVGAAYFVYYLLLDRQTDIKKLIPTICLFSKDISKSEYVEYLNSEYELYNVDLKIGDMTPIFEFVSDSGTIINNNFFENKFYIINFNSSNGNSHSKREAKIIELANKNIEKNIYFVSIFIGKEDKHTNINKEKPVNYYTFHSKDYWETKITKSFGVNNLPYCFIIDNNDRILSINPTLQQIDSLCCNIHNNN